MQRKIKTMDSLWSMKTSQKMKMTITTTVKVMAGQEDQLPHTQNGTGESPISSGDDDEKDNTQIPPLSYSTNQLALDVKSVDKYKYYPINSVYYLPPINVVYFPHRAHQSQKDDQEQTSIVQENRKSSNVYFK